MGKAIKGMSLDQAKSYYKELKGQGKSESTSKEMGKLSDYIATLQPEKHGEERLGEAYSKLSRGVTTTGGWTEKNLGNIEKYTGERPQLTAPKTSEQLPSYLSGYQDSVFNSSNNVELRDSIVNQLEPDMEKPEPLNRVETYEEMRGSMGVTELETTLTDLKAQLEEEYATTRARRFDAEGKPVELGVIGGRVSEIERQQNERVDTLGRQINVINDQLTTAYNVISTYMNFMSLDYQDATNAYNTEFNRNLQIYNLMDEEMDEQMANAKANLQTYQNAIVSGNISYSNLSSDQKGFITKLEAQAGLPIGFTASLKPEEKVIYSGTRDSGGVKYLDYITRGADGQPNSQTISLGASASGNGNTSGSISTSTRKYFVQEASKYLEEADTMENPSDTGDKQLSFTEAQAAYNRIIGLVNGDEDTADEIFNQAMNSGGYSKYGDW